jgi:microcystin-dependent protein
MKNTYIIAILLSIMSSQIVFAQVGINTESPTRTLDVNGDMRVRSLPSTTTTSDKSMLSVDTNGNINSIKSVSGKVGDVKHGLETADHNGWYLMNGRAVSTLPATAQTGAGTLGISTLPNMTDRMIRTQTTETVGSLGGANSNTLSQANMPAYTTVSKSTTQSCNHTHSFGDLYEWPAAWSYQPGYSYGHNLYANHRTTSAAGNHAHSVTAPTGGSGQPLNIVPEFLAVNTFIYLGQ